MEPLHPQVDDGSHTLGAGEALSPSTPSVPQRAVDFARTHWKAIGLVALGLVALRSRRLRPVVTSAMKTAATAYLVPTARNLLSRARA